MADATTKDPNKTDDAEETAKIKAATASGKKATDEARKQDEATNKAHDALRPYPSQEEADRMKMTAASGALSYVTRDAKAG